MKLIFCATSNVLNRPGLGRCSYDAATAWIVRGGMIASTVRCSPEMSPPLCQRSCRPDRIRTSGRQPRLLLALASSRVHCEGGGAKHRQPVTLTIIKFPTGVVGRLQHDPASKSPAISAFKFPMETVRCLKPLAWRVAPQCAFGAEQSVHYPEVLDGTQRLLHSTR